ncbi:MAG: (d)CMP kinase [Microbacteriaceae bacterium]|nr:(d)CMP kinase [Microbacteriaceae bacterium]
MKATENSTQAASSAGCRAPLLVAIDGPAGSGKSSVARAAAKSLSFGILDTGAAYRALTWQLLQNGADLTNQAAALTALDNWRLQLDLQNAATVTLDDRDITAEIRTPAVAGQVSSVSKHDEVRFRLNAWFRNTVATSGLPGVVIEGRDITTVVAPHAPVRLILTAAADVRAARRAAEMPQLSFEQVQQDLAARDARDLQVVDFINPAPGVTLLDTTDLDFDGAVAAVVAEIRRAQNSL